MGFVALADATNIGKSHLWACLQGVSREDWHVGHGGPAPMWAALSNVWEPKWKQRGEGGSNRAGLSLLFLVGDLAAVTALDLSSRFFSLNEEL